MSMSPAAKEDDEVRRLSMIWIEAKEKERQAVEQRRAAEDELSKLLDVDEAKDGTTNLHLGPYRVKVVSRLNRKVDSDKLQDVAREAGLSDYLPTLFRWKAEINMSSWRSADEKITNPLLEAITTVPSRPSYQIIFGE